MSDSYSRFSADIVERLRKPWDHQMDELCLEAADEIDRLQAERDELREMMGLKPKVEARRETEDRLLQKAALASGDVLYDLPRSSAENVEALADRLEGLGRFEIYMSEDQTRHQRVLLSEAERDLIVSALRAQPQASSVSVDDLIPLFRDAASVNMTEDAVGCQARRFAEAVISIYDVRRK